MFPKTLYRCLLMNSSLCVQCFVSWRNPHVGCPNVLEYVYQEDSCATYIIYLNIHHMGKWSRAILPAWVWPWTLAFDPDLGHTLGSRLTTVVQASDPFLENVLTDPPRGLGQGEETLAIWCSWEGGWSLNTLLFLKEATAFVSLLIDLSDAGGSAWRRIDGCVRLT